jgi:NAD(P)-dependent dehydrogenase (short-subunit alcohol dehydrogenase family)
MRAARDALYGTPLRLSIVYPGYVDTPMSRRLKGPQPLRWSAEKAAAHIRRRLDQGADDIVFPRTLAWGIRLLHLLPMPLAAFFTRRFACVVEPDGEAPFAPQGGPQQGSNDA